MTEVSDARDGKEFYLPHRAVIKECSFTTKVRDIAEVWLETRNELAQLDNFSCPRRVMLETSREIQLHGYCDASERAYGACIYIRTLDHSDRWIRTAPHLLKTFVANRVSEIQTDSDPHRKTAMPKGSRILNLNPFLDQDKLLRVGGRLRHAPLSYCQKHPLLLPHRHHITNLIIESEHLRHWHAGTQATLNAVRQIYWPIDGMRATKIVIHKCIRCFRVKPKVPAYIMGDLPKNRVTRARPFQNVGVDYCGPFFIKEKKVRNRCKIKTYVAIFVCFVTKAIHLELTSDLTTESCLGAFKRFFARRGKATNIYSDNGTNFVGAKNEITEVQRFLSSNEHNSKINRFLSDQGINWHFSPPRSPHFGGLWEAAVKSFKGHLYKTIGNELFTFEQLNTYIIEVEAILNSRPLTPLSSDQNDLTALSPSHFLIGDSLMQLPEYDLRDTPVNKLSSWQHIQRVKQHFWNRWSNEYLQTLHTRNKWHIPNDTQHKKGTLVIIWEDNTPPFMRPGQSITADLYCNQLEDMVRQLQITQSRLVNRDRPFLLQDNS
ncbi:uncharacterized protein LOC143260976 [Megalopta genalis]|uniref:uncharacterized protein LOC143260976 n=1 Tax=Megalopta genalis TaxID=115081 RepID=UPI003FD5157D